MKRALLLVFFVVLGANCASRTTSQANRDAIQNAQPSAQPIVESAKPATADSGAAASPKREKEVPPEFKSVDFRNFTYPSSLRGSSITLKDGDHEYEDPVSGGDRYHLQDVNYADVTGDGKKEAVVNVVRVICGGSCDGGSHLFYIYSAQQNRPRLLWRIESGSVAYGCGLKSFIVNRSTITLEAFRKCHLKSVFLASESNPKELGKFQAIGLTRFIFGFDGKNFVLKKREVSASVETDAKNYSPEIRVSDD